MNVKIQTTNKALMNSKHTSYDLLETNVQISNVIQKRNNISYVYLKNDILAQ